MNRLRVVNISNNTEPSQFNIYFIMRETMMIIALHLLPTVVCRMVFQFWFSFSVLAWNCKSFILFLQQRLVPDYTDWQRLPALIYHLIIQVWTRADITCAPCSVGICSREWNDVMAAILKVWHHIRNLTVNRRVFAWRTILPNFIPIRYDRMGALGFLKSIAQQKQQQPEQAEYQFLIQKRVLTFLKFTVHVLFVTKLSYQ